MAHSKVTSMSCDFDICGRDHDPATTYMVYRLRELDNYFQVRICDTCAKSTHEADDCVVIWAQSLDYVLDFGVL